MDGGLRGRVGILDGKEPRILSVSGRWTMVVAVDHGTCGTDFDPSNSSAMVSVSNL